jgi:hypothetical protein
MSAGHVLSQGKDKGKGSNADAAKATASSPQVQAAEAIRTAHALARYGDAKKDALALITAAKIKKETGEQELKAKEATKGGKGGKGDESKVKPDGLTADAMLARAKALAADRKDLLALAEDVSKSGTRGAVGGPRSGTRVVCSNCNMNFTVSFEGNAPAYVAISGDGDSRLDMFVYDENGNNICRQVGPGDDAACRWHPRWTGPFTIRVVNYGIANRFRIWTN